MESVEPVARYSSIVVNSLTVGNSHNSSAETEDTQRDITHKPGRERTQAPPSTEEDPSTGTTTITCPAFSDDAQKLTTKDTYKVYKMMFKARAKWRNIGGEFGVAEHILQNIDSEHKKNEDKLREVIIHRLQAKDMTWKDVADALQSETVDQPQLAQKVEHKYFPHPYSFSASDSVTSEPPTLSTHQGK